MAWRVKFRKRVARCRSGRPDPEEEMVRGKVAGEREDIWKARGIERGEE